MSKTGVFDREIPRLAPKPKPCEALRQNAVCLDGIWEFCHRAEQGEASGWHGTAVPSHIGAYADEAEGFTGIYSYRRTIRLLPEWRETRKLLKFEGVNGYARVAVDGEAAAEHWNGFLTWTVDITELCGGKDEILLQVDVDETKDRAGCFYHGGILHSVWLYLLPQTYLSMAHVSAELDAAYENAVLTAHCSAEAHLDGCRLRGVLLDPCGAEVAEGSFCEPIGSGSWDAEISRKIPQPFLWDAEHPQLYTLRLYVCRNGEVLESTERRFGFRQIERRGNRVFVNGKEIKLRGVCRHEVSARHGRCLTKELIDEDVRLFKEANCNYIRTSHYPPSEYFLEACDREGVYVEDELGLAFIAKNTPYTQRDPGETKRFLSHFQEAMARDYSHPCVLIWSLCNESFGGYNFDVLNRYVHQKDPTRLTKFSYPMTMRLEHEPVDVWSIHYSNHDADLSDKLDNVSVGRMEGKDVPVIHDEYAHIPCYNREEHRRDPNVRNFWGESIRRFWERIWNTPGALGGAIWAGIDETDVFTGGNTQLEWGIIDIWRRKKPEFYLVRKAYSPIVIREAFLRRSAEGSAALTVENRFCHTDLSETQVLVRAGEYCQRLAGPHAAPGEEGELLLYDLPESGSLELFWRDAQGRLTDEYRLEIRGAKERGGEQECSKEACVPWELRREGGFTALVRGAVRVVFDEESARICEGAVGEHAILAGGPDLNMNGVVLGEWKKEAFEANGGQTPEVALSGWYGKEVKAAFRLRFCEDGTIHTAYRIDELNIPMPDRVKLRVSVSAGGLNEIGISLLCAPGMDALSWKRRGAWTVYPEDHIGRNEGLALRESEGSVFGREPQTAWKDEMQNTVLNGRYDVSCRGTNDFRSQKEHIYRAALYRRADRAGIAAVSDGSHSVRAEVVEPADCLIPCTDPRIRYTGDWIEMTDPHAGADYREMWAKGKGCAAELDFEGTGIVWYGPVDVVYGYAAVYVDGQPADGRILQRVNGVDFPGSADGYDKKYRYPLYSADNLPYGKHTIRIEPLGEGSAESQDTYIAIECFRILDGGRPEPVRFYINNACNYPMISWGNYCREPILVEAGYENEAVFCLENVREKADGAAGKGDRDERGYEGKPAGHAGGL